MNVISLNEIVTNILLKRRYSMHWYLDFLVPAKDCLRELSFDLPMNAVRYKVLNINDNHAIEIPDDFEDVVKVSVRIGQYLKPLVEDNSLDLVPNYDSNFDIQPYSTGVATDTNQQLSYYNGYLAPLWFMVNWNAFGENTGRQFGGVSTYSDTYKVNRARNEIKINENLAYTQYVLEYISNGLDSDSATHIIGYAQNCIEAYCMWQFKEHNRTYTPSEAELEHQKYITERQILTARLSDITIDKLKRLVQRNSIAIKY